MPALSARHSLFSFQSLLIVLLRRIRIAATAIPGPPLTVCVPACCPVGVHSSGGLRGFPRHRIRHFRVDASVRGAVPGI